VPAKFLLPHPGITLQSGQHDLFPAAPLHRGDEIFIVPGVHGGMFNGRLVREDCLDLRPDIPAETLGFHGAEDYGDLENPGSFGERHIVVDDRLAVKIGYAKEHLGLEIDNLGHAVVRFQQPFFAPRRTTTGVRHDFFLLEVS
jgi:hypothetical protein